MLTNKTGLKVLYPELYEGVCPVGFPILVEKRDEVRKRLLRKKINLRTYWDILPGNISHSEYPFAYEISKKILILPVHQSLEEKHLNYTAQNLLSVI